MVGLKTVNHMLEGLGGGDGEGLKPVLLVALKARRHEGEHVERQVALAQPAPEPVPAADRPQEPRRRELSFGWWRRLRLYVMLDSRCDGVTTAAQSGLSGSQGHELNGALKMSLRFGVRVGSGVGVGVGFGSFSISDQFTFRFARA